MADIFAESHRAKERTDNQQKAKAIIEQRKQDAAKKMLERMKPVFNDLPHYKPRDAFKLAGPR